MKIKIVRIEKDLPLPEYKTEGAVAFDLYTRDAATIAPKDSALLRTNLIVEVPEGHALVLAARSSLGPKRGLIMRNAIGIIDRDYHGPEDEIKLFVYNFTSEPVSIERGERLAQGLILPVARAEWEEVSEMKEESRGGFGSTG
jgi:dUTP pyrophosphatase